MALVILEGVDRTGKSSVAKSYAEKGFQVIHQSAPKKGINSDLFLEEQVQIVASAASRDIVLDRSYYGELVWPEVYGRESLLTSEGLETLRELEESVGTTRILMWDNNVEAHWKRCLENNEPLTKAQFVKARTLFAKLQTYGFEQRILRSENELQLPNTRDDCSIACKKDENRKGDNVYSAEGEFREMKKLELANAISSILSKRILKKKGPVYDQLEENIRTYLNGELAKIFGDKESAVPTNFTAEEVELLKFFCGRLKEGKR